jgi:hypothetical protein
MNSLKQPIIRKHSPERFPLAFWRQNMEAYIVKPKRFLIALQFIAEKELFDQNT